MKSSSIVQYTLLLGEAFFTALDRIDHSTNSLVARLIGTRINTRIHKFSFSCFTFLQYYTVALKNKAVRVGIMKTPYVGQYIPEMATYQFFRTSNALILHNGF